MDENIKVFIDIIQNDLEMKIEYDLLKEPNVKEAYVDDILLKLATLRDKKLNDIILKYKNDQKEIRNKTRKLHKEMQILAEGFINNMNEILEDIKKL